MTIQLRTKKHVVFFFSHWKNMGPPYIPACTATRLNKNNIGDVLRIILLTQPSLHNVGLEAKQEICSNNRVG
jgi:hypothetical protein